MEATGGGAMFSMNEETIERATTAEVVEVKRSESETKPLSSPMNVTLHFPYPLEHTSRMIGCRLPSPAC